MYGMKDLVMLKMSMVLLDVFAILYVLSLRYDIYSYKKVI